MKRNVAWPYTAAPVAVLCALAVGAVSQTASPQVLDPADARERVRDPRWVIVDARDPDAFNGWALGGEARGGHVPGAANFATAWLEQDRKGIRERLTPRGVLGTRPLLVYGRDTAEGEQAAALLRRRFRVAPERLHVLRGGFAAWSADPKLPVDRLARWDRLVPAAWLARAVQENSAVRIYEVGWRKEAEYAKGHVPGAVYFDSERFEVGPLWSVIPAADLTRALTALGITSATPTVLYGRDPMPAFRAAVVLMYAGVRDVRVLNGGLAAWTRHGRALEHGSVRATAARDFGARVPDQPSLVTGIANARRLLAGPNSVLADVRSWKEYVGEITGYADLKQKGRIPGAVWGGGGSDVSQMEHLRNPDGTVRDYHDIARRWASAGIVPEKQVGFYCGTGWRASEAFYAAWLMGWPYITVYDPGWYEWSADPANPISRGEPDSEGKRSRSR